MPFAIRSNELVGGGQFVPLTKSSSSESRLRIFLKYSAGSLLSVKAAITSFMQKYHFSCTSSQIVLICFSSKIFNSCIVITLSFNYPQEHFGDKKALEKSLACWKYIKENLIDKDNGEWFWSIYSDGSINRMDDKAGFWKCPYHNGRMCMEIIERLLKTPPSARQKSSL